jgi:adenylyltransferase/sulfurtransferase
MTIHIPTPLRAYTNGQDSVSVNAGTVATALADLVGQFPGLKNNLYGSDGKLRSFVNIYLNDEDIRYLQSKEDTVTKPTDELSIIPSIAGGSLGR